MMLFIKIVTIVRVFKCILKAVSCNAPTIYIVHVYKSCNLPVASLSWPSALLPQRMGLEVALQALLLGREDRRSPTATTGSVTTA